MSNSRKFGSFYAKVTTTIRWIRRRSRLVAACRRTSGCTCAERNSRRSQILAAANIQVALARVNKFKLRDSMAISKQLIR